MPFDLTKAKPAPTFNHVGTFYALAADHESGRLYAGSDDGGIHVFDRQAKKPEAVACWRKHDNYVAALVWLEEVGLVSASYDGKLLWWDSECGATERSVAAHAGWVRDLIATPDGARLISAGDDMCVRIWNAASGELVRSLEGHSVKTPQGHVNALYAVAVSPDGGLVASADRIGSVRIWDLATGQVRQQFEVPILYTYDPRQRKRSMGGIRSLAWSGDGKQLAVGGIGQVGNVDGLAGPAHVEVWDWRQPRQVFAGGVEAHKGIINALTFHPEGGLLGVGGGSDNGFLACWPIAAGKNPAPQRLKTDGHWHRVILGDSGKELIAAGFRKLAVWTLPSTTENG